MFLFKLSISPILPALFGSLKYCVEVHCFFQAVTGLCRKANISSTLEYVLIRRDKSLTSVHHQQISRNLELLLTWKHDTAIQQLKERFSSSSELNRYKALDVLLTGVVNENITAYHEIDVNDLQLQLLLFLRKRLNRCGAGNEHPPRYATRSPWRIQRGWSTGLIAACLSCVVGWSWKKLQCNAQTENVAAQHHYTNQA